MKDSFLIGLIKSISTNKDRKNSWTLIYAQSKLQTGKNWVEVNRFCHSVDTVTVGLFYGYHF